MSAAAAAARLRTSRSRRTPLPPELSEQVQLPDRDHARIPNAFFSAIRLKFWTAFEKDIALILAERSYAGCPDGRGGWNRPKWVELPAKEVALALGNVGEDGHAKVEGIEKCLKALEDRRLIESLLVGRVKYYRLCPENFDAAADRQVRSIERKPPESAEEVHIREVAPSEPLILLVGEKSRPYAFGDFRGSLTAGPQLSSPVSLVPSINQDGGLDWLVDGYQGEKEAKTDSRTRVRLSAARHENKGSGESNGPQKQSAAEEIERAERGVMGDFLKRWFGRELGDPSDAVVQQVIEALGGAPSADFAARIKKRAPELEYLSWKIVIGLAADVGREFAKRKARSARPEIPEPPLSPDQLSELDQFSKRQRERFRK